MINDNQKYDATIFVINFLEYIFGERRFQVSPMHPDHIETTGYPSGYKQFLYKLSDEELEYIYNFMESARINACISPAHIMNFAEKEITVGISTLRAICLKYFNYRFPGEIGGCVANLSRKGGMMKQKEDEMKKEYNGIVSAMVDICKNVQ